MRSTVTAIVAAAMVLMPGTAFAADPIKHTVVINEAQTRGIMGTTDEYIEFQNISNAAVDLSDYRLRFTEPGKPSVLFWRLPFG